METGGQVEAILLGAAQDAGVPQAGCDCVTCAQARHDPAQRQFAACLGLIDRQAGAAFLIDATPDLREPLEQAFFSGGLHAARTGGLGRDRVIKQEAVGQGIRARLEPARGSD